MINLDTIKSNPLFEVYYNLIVEWNKKFNLTAITQRDEVYVKHFLDSLSASELLFDGANVLDIGSGAGLPAVALKIINPFINFTLIDSVNKKVMFLNHVKQVLNLTNFDIFHSRIEDFGKRNYYDFVTARAVAPLNVLCEYALPFLKIKGKFIAYKSHLEQIPTNALNTLGGELDSIINKNIMDMERNLVIIKKVKPTPDIYPRKFNKARLHPL